MTDPGQRKPKGILIQPYLQLKLGFIGFGLSVLFCFVMIAILYGKFLSFPEVMVGLADADSEVYQVLDDYLESIIFEVSVGIAAFLAVNLVVSTFMTHRMVGPTIAFGRHLDALRHGDYEARVRLRKTDSFKELAEKHNQLAENLSRKYGTAQKVS